MAVPGKHESKGREGEINEAAGGEVDGRRGGELRKKKTSIIESLGQMLRLPLPGCCHGVFQSFYAKFLRQMHK